MVGSHTKLGWSGVPAPSDAETPRSRGTPDECREKLTAFSGVLDHVILHTPYVPPLRPDETEDAYRWIVRTFDRSSISA